MRFGNRFIISRGNPYLKRREHYWRHLDEIGLSKNDPLYRLFGGEVFHDSEISIDQIRLTDGVAVLQLRNVHAVDEVGHLLRSRKGRKIPKFNLADFRTKVTFRGVKRLEIRFGCPAEEFYYHSAELDRIHEDLQIKIYLITSGEEPGWIKILFKSAQVEDIRKRLRRYLPRGVDPDNIISFINEDWEGGKEETREGRAKRAKN